MKSKEVKFNCHAAIACLLALGVFAGSWVRAEDCGALLKPDYTAISRDTRYRNVFYSFASDTQLEDIKKSAGAHIDGFGATNEETRRQNRSWINTVRSDFSQSDAWTYVSNRVPDTRTAAFVQCMHAAPLRLDLDGPPGHSFTLVLRWDSPILPLQLTQITLTLLNAQVVGASVPSAVGSQSEFRITLQRQNDNAKTTVNLNALPGGTNVYKSAGFADPGEVPPPPPDPLLGTWDLQVQRDVLSQTMCTGSWTIPDRMEEFACNLTCPGGAAPAARCKAQLLGNALTVNYQRVSNGAYCHFSGSTSAPNGWTFNCDDYYPGSALNWSATKH